MKWIAEEDGLCLFLEVTDEQLERIRIDCDYYKDDVFMAEAYSAKGKNCHIFTLINNGDVARLIFYMKQLMSDYKTVSWWNKTKTEFLIRRK